ncbi:hypothetical protein B0H65DRAFT_218680 [Neurospora tetraspora]|uniref:Uncharacterized protein n=1 Tax=Neurospora tetraspora TaxID=94610 RepID=A0AAE0JCN4_9PEZI|nr:hypothetical protein B0H65DRAFT_218680 [Neurospora tetraspora]
MIPDILRTRPAGMIHLSGQFPVSGVNDEVALNRSALNTTDDTIPNAKHQPLLTSSTARTPETLKVRHGNGQTRPSPTATISSLSSRVKYCHVVLLLTFASNGLPFLLAWTQCCPFLEDHRGTPKKGTTKNHRGIQQFQGNPASHL